MPNHVINVLKFKKVKKDDIDFLLNMITTESEHHPGTYHIDFNKIIPEPKEESECPEDCIVDRDSHVELTEDKPWFNWYEWRNRYWDTKWNAYDSYSIISEEDETLTLVFNTAWSPPLSVIKRLIVLGYPFVHRWADECMVENCGETSWSGEQGWRIAWTDEAFEDPSKESDYLWSEFGGMDFSEE